MGFHGIATLMFSLVLKPHMKFHDYTTLMFSFSLNPSLNSLVENYAKIGCSSFDQPDLQSLNDCRLFFGLATEIYRNFGACNLPSERS